MRALRAGWFGLRRVLASAPAGTRRARWTFESVYLDAIRVAVVLLLASGGAVAIGQGSAADILALVAYLALFAGIVLAIVPFRRGKPGKELS